MELIIMWSIVGGVFFLFFFVLGIVYYTCRKLINEFQEKKIKQRLGIVDEPVVVEETLPKKKKKKKKDITKKVSFESNSEMQNNDLALVAFASE
jgi:Na+-transporting methylmalonyl-CoA/oxaloacetate decarboxylase gamma subunit